MYNVIKVILFAATLSFVITLFAERSTSSSDGLVESKEEVDLPLDTNKAISQRAENISQ